MRKVLQRFRRASAFLLERGEGGGHFAIRFSMQRMMLLLNGCCTAMVWIGFTLLIPMLPLIFSGRAFCYGVPPIIVGGALLGTSGAVGWLISLLWAHDRKSLFLGLIPAIFWLLWVYEYFV